MDEKKNELIEEKARNIKLLILDVDGVLTDGSIHVSEKGEETKSFYVKDGYGLKLLMECGIELAIISGRKSGAVDRRAKELGVKMVFQGVKDKGPVCRQIMEQAGLKESEVASVGDDLPELSVFRHSGIRIAVADAVQEIREAADLVTSHEGGRGAVREVSEWILKLQGKWEATAGGPNGK